jgi:Bacteriophage probable baseplate hub protein
MATSQFDLSGLLVFNTKLTVLLGGMDATGMFPPLNKLSLSYEDSMAFKADNLEIICADIGDVLINSALIFKGQMLRVKIETYNRDYPGHYDMRDTGAFEIDEIEQTGPPTIVRIAATSVPVTGNVKMTIKHRRWEKETLYNIANQIATESKLKLQWDVDPADEQEAKYADITFNEVEQEYESDLKFLARLCRRFGLSVAVKGDKQLVIFSESVYEDKPPIYALDFKQPVLNKMLHWNLTTRAMDTYKQAKIQYMPGDIGGGDDENFDVPAGGDQPASEETAVDHTMPLPAEPVEDTPAGD